MANSECIFCKIIHREVPGRIEYEDDLMVCFPDIHPKAPTHLLIVAKEHIESLNEATDDKRDLLGAMMIQARNEAQKRGINMSGYKLIMNCGRDGGQTIDHIHLHLLGGQPIQAAV